MKKLWPLLLLPLLAALAAGAGSTVTVRSTVLQSQVNVAGASVAERSPGQISVHYERSDRGRGPKLDERIAVGPNGVPTKIDVTGVDYGIKVDEHFERTTDGMARWKNRSEQGEAKAPANAFYMSLFGTPEERRLMTLALKAAPGHTLPLLPAGEVRSELAKTLQLTPSKGKPRSFTLWAISGLGFTPSFAWLSDDGTLSAGVDSNTSSVVPEGFESSVPAMLQEQEQWQVARAAALAKTLAHRPVGPLAVTHANLFDAEHARMVPGQTVVIRGHTIEAVGKDGEVQLPKDAEVIDAAGKALLPGLWDMHAHLWGAADGLLHLQAGVTSVRDLANDADELARTRKRFDEGTQIGPRVLAAGFIDGRGPNQAPTKVFADNEAEAKAVVADYVKRGYVQIKVYSSLKPELVPVIAKLAHENGLRLSGHVPSGMKAEEFVRAGADEIQHMNMVFLNFLDVKDTSGMDRFTEVAAHGAEIDPASPKVKAFIKLLLERHTTVDPTLVAHEWGLTDRPGQMSNRFAAVGDRFPAQVRRGLFFGGLEVPPGMEKRYKDSFRQMQNMTRALYEAGVSIVAGADSTDEVAGFGYHRELELYEDAGIPAPKVLQIATLGAARVMKKDQELGTIAPGKLADLILVDGDPSKHISDIRKVRTVIKDGTRYVVSELDQALGVRPAP
ncbi:MAG TPA: amidohydrolase family protein [Myxococcaceae bacterium]|nr:amidohydrolase family protein [Myxococcaceae bacterium]